VRKSHFQSRYNSTYGSPTLTLRSFHAFRPRLRTSLLAPPGLLSAASAAPPMPLVTNDESGLEQIFEGKTLPAGKANPKYWRVEGRRAGLAKTATNCSR